MIRPSFKSGSTSQVVQKSLDERLLRRMTKLRIAFSQEDPHEFLAVYVSCLTMDVLECLFDGANPDSVSFDEWCLLVTCSSGNWQRYFFYWSQHKQLFDSLVVTEESLKEVATQVVKTAGRF